MRFRCGIYGCALQGVDSSARFWEHLRDPVAPANASPVSGGGYCAQRSGLHDRFRHSGSNKVAASAALA
jgi:hypothetical protein